MEKAMWQEKRNLEMQSRELWRWRKRNSDTIASFGHHTFSHCLITTFIGCSVHMPFLSSSKQKICKITVIIKNIVFFWNFGHLCMIEHGDYVYYKVGCGRETMNSQSKRSIFEYEESHGLLGGLVLAGKDYFLMVRGTD